MRNGVIILATSLLFIIQAKAANLGSVEIAGNACQVPVGTHDLTEVSTGRYEIPLGLYVKKEEDSSIARGVCTFALSVAASAGKKIVISNARQLVNLRTYPSQTKARIDLEIFRAGQRGEPQKLEVVALDKAARSQKVLEQAEILFETECAGSAILRGNLAGTMVGAGKSRVFARNLFVDIKEVSCQ